MQVGLPHQREFRNFTGAAAPDLIYLPEKVFSIGNFISDVRKKLSEKPNIVIAVSEGIRTANGAYICEINHSSGTDAFGHKLLTGTAKALELIVKETIGCKVRSVELNISQRCAAHIASLTDFKESIDVGKAGVDAALTGSSGVMMAITRENTPEYSVIFEPVDVHNVANQVRSVPAEFINDSGNYVTDECIHYLAPLIRGELAMEYENGLPKVFRI